MAFRTVSSASELFMIAQRTYASPASALTKSRTRLSRPQAVRAITYTPVQNKHVTDKDSSLNVQSDASQKSQQDAAKGKGSQAETGQDQGNNAAKAKQEHPEAPDPAIGFQDERGGKGV